MRKAEAGTLTANQLCMEIESAQVPEAEGIFEADQPWANFMPWFWIAHAGFYCMARGI